MSKFWNSFIHPLGCLGAALCGAGVAWLMQPSGEEPRGEQSSALTKRDSKTSAPVPGLLDVLVEITAPKKAI